MIHHLKSNQTNNSVYIILIIYLSLSFPRVFRTNLMLNETNSSGLTDREKKMFATSERIFTRISPNFH